jgi:glutaredoxin
MEFEEPSELGFTVYSKSGCHNCNKVKELLQEKNFLFKTVDCDDYIIEEKANFLFFIKEKANMECKIFPMIFFDKKYIGGYSETKKYVDAIFLTFEDVLSF